MLIGAHMGRAGGLAASFMRGVGIGAEVVQLFTQSPRPWRPPADRRAEVDEFLEVAGGHPEVRRTFCHATYLINLATPDPDMAGRSVACLVDNLSVTAAIGADALVLHVGSHRGAGLEGCLAVVGAHLRRALTEVGGVRLLLENTAGGGGTIGRSWEELAMVIEACGGDPRLGVCLDTQHLWASGVDYTTLAGADRALADLDRHVGLDRLACVHLNDSKAPLGSNRDRHENIGEGAIGLSGLAALLGHPALQGLPAVLEVAGPEGRGPTAADLDRARRMVASGVRRRARRRPAAKREGDQR